MGIGSNAYMQKYKIYKIINIIRRFEKCNGDTSEKTFKKYNKHIYNSVCHRKVPSSSPTPGRYVKTLKEKKSEWKIALGQVENMPSTIAPPKQSLI